MTGRLKKDIRGGSNQSPLFGRFIQTVDDPQPPNWSRYPNANEYHIAYERWENKRRKRQKIMAGRLQEFKSSDGSVVTWVAGMLYILSAHTVDLDRTIILTAAQAIALEEYFEADHSQEQVIEKRSDQNF